MTKPIATDTQPLKPEGGPMSDLLTVTIPGTSVLDDERVEAIRTAAENLLGELADTVRRAERAAERQP